MKLVDEWNGVWAALALFLLHSTKRSTISRLFSLRPPSPLIRRAKPGWKVLELCLIVFCWTVVEELKKVIDWGGTARQQQQKKAIKH